MKVILHNYFLGFKKLLVAWIAVNKQKRKARLSQLTPRKIR
jgi:hypothetical protein